MADPKITYDIEAAVKGEADADAPVGHDNGRRMLPAAAGERGADDGQVVARGHSGEWYPNRKFKVNSSKFKIVASNWLRPRNGAHLTSRQNF